MTEHDFAQYVRTLGRGKRARRSLTLAEAEAAMGAILQGKVTDAQLGAFLMLLRVKEETPEELAGMIAAVRHNSADLAPLPPVALDWACYAGKKKQPPWYLLAAWIIARSGHTVLLHGGAHHTPGRHYIDTTLEQLGWPVASSIEGVAHQLGRDNISFLPLSLYAPALDRLLMLREQLGLRSAINTLARSLNPAAAPVSLQSVFHPAYLKLHEAAADLLGDGDTLMFKGEGGEAEIRPDATTRVLHRHQGALQPWECATRCKRPETPAPLTAQSLKQCWVNGDDAYGVAAVITTLTVALKGLEPALAPEAAAARAEALWQSRDRGQLPFALEPA